MRCNYLGGKRHITSASLRIGYDMWHIWCDITFVKFQYSIFKVMNNFIVDTSRLFHMGCLILLEIHLRTSSQFKNKIDLVILKQVAQSYWSYFFQVLVKSRFFGNKVRTGNFTFFMLPILCHKFLCTLYIIEN